MTEEEEGKEKEKEKEEEEEEEEEEEKTKNYKISDFKKSSSESGFEEGINEVENQLRFRGLTSVNSGQI
jgi:hypothetical protein